MTFPGLDTKIRDVQLIERDILFYIDEFCRKHKIRYVLFAGTLIGAVRHNGFIPWDDDVDICMLRDDYDRFLEIARKELDHKFVISNYYDEPGSTLLFTKIRLRDSLMIQKAYQYDKTHHGIFIDIFPMDNVKPGEIVGLKQEKAANKWFVLSSSLSKSRCDYTSNSITRLIRHSIRLTLSLLPKNLIFRLAEKEFRKFNHEETPYVATLTNGMPPREMDRFKMKREEFYDLTELEFEGKMLPAPKDYDTVLSRAYGNYMEYPPEEHRIPLHQIIAIQLPK